MATQSTLYDELTGIITAHITDIAPYVTDVAGVASRVSEHLLMCIERLTYLKDTPPQYASRETYQEASECQEELTSFLRSMNRTADVHLDNTIIGEILRQTATWLSRAPREFRLTKNDVWDLIAPAVPDHMDDLGNGQYEARWWKPVPVMDIEILKYTEGICISTDPFEPENLPGGLALRFSVTASAASAPLD